MHLKKEKKMSDSDKKSENNKTKTVQYINKTVYIRP